TYTKNKSSLALSKLGRICVIVRCFIYFNMFVIPENFLSLHQAGKVFLFVLKFTYLPGEQEPSNGEGGL
ncbi:MAG: hypothetical protein IJQ47_05130, partial [Synergistaceae bacterium]|nr:hypothetical protein [Synergistaceae bacterium]